MHNEPIQLLDLMPTTRWWMRCSAAGWWRPCLLWIPYDQRLPDRYPIGTASMKRPCGGAGHQWLGFTTIRKFNSVEAWLGSLPGHERQCPAALVHLNLAHLMPLSSVWAGPAATTIYPPPLFHAETSGSTPFRFSTHGCRPPVDCRSHWRKSVLLALMAMQFRR